MSPEPVITVTVSDALARIESKVDNINTLMVTKADQGFVHELDSRLRVVETAQATVSAVQEAATKARARMWGAIAGLSALLASATTVFGLLIARR